MPTAAKLFAALAFAAVGFLTAEAFKPLVPEQSQWGNFTVICTVLGAFSGWRVAGPRLGRGWGAAVGVGLSAGVVLLVLAATLFSIREMVLRSMNFRYDGPLEAAVGTFAILLEYAALMGDARFLGTLVAGSILGGLIGEAAGRMWR